MVSLYYGVRIIIGGQPTTQAKKNVSPRTCSRNVSPRMRFEERKWNATKSFRRTEYLYLKVILPNQTSLSGEEMVGYIILVISRKRPRYFARV